MGVLTDSIHQGLRGTHVLDGDTVDLADGERVRLLGVDATETGTQPAAVAKRRLTDLILESGLTTVERHGQDNTPGKRTLGTIKDAQGRDINARLVEEGYVNADAYTAGPYGREAQIAANKFQTGQLPDDKRAALDSQKNWRAPPPRKPRRSTDLSDDYGRGIASGIENIQAALHGVAALAGDALGAKGLREFGEEGYRRNTGEAEQFSPTIARLEDVSDMDSFLSWSAGVLGQATPSVATSVAAGGLTGIGARAAVQASVKRLVSRGLSKEMAEKAVVKALASDDVAARLMKATKYGAMAGAGATSVVQQMGEVQGELIEHGLSNPAAAFGLGLAGGALDALPVLRLVDKLFPGVDRAVAKSFVRGMTKEMGIQSLIEGSTEGAQEALQLAAVALSDPSFEWNTDENKSRILNAAAAGALVGVVSGTPGGVIEGVRARSQNGKPETKPVPDPRLGSAKFPAGTPFTGPPGGPPPPGGPAAAPRAGTDVAVAATAALASASPLAAVPGADVAGAVPDQPVAAVAAPARAGSSIGPSGRVGEPIRVDLGGPAAFMDAPQEQEPLPGVNAQDDVRAFLDRPGQREDVRRITEELRREILAKAEAEEGVRGVGGEGSQAGLNLTGGSGGAPSSTPAVDTSVSVGGREQRQERLPLTTAIMSKVPPIKADKRPFPEANIDPAVGGEPGAQPVRIKQPIQNTSGDPDLYTAEIDPEASFVEDSRAGQVDLSKAVVDTEELHEGFNELGTGRQLFGKVQNTGDRATKKRPKGYQGEPGTPPTGAFQKRLDELAAKRPDSIFEPVYQDGAWFIAETAAPAEDSVFDPREQERVGRDKYIETSIDRARHFGAKIDAREPGNERKVIELVNPEGETVRLGTSELSSAGIRLGEMGRAETQRGLVEMVGTLMDAGWTVPPQSMERLGRGKESAKRQPTSFAQRKEFAERSKQQADDQKTRLAKEPVSEGNLENEDDTADNRGRYVGEDSEGKDADIIQNRKRFMRKKVEDQKGEDQFSTQVEEGADTEKTKRDLDDREEVSKASSKPNKSEKQEALDREVARNMHAAMRKNDTVVFGFEKDAARITALVDNLREVAGIRNNRIVIMDKAGVEKAIASGRFDFLKLINFRPGLRGSVVMQGDTAYIYLEKGDDVVTLGHEIGHVVAELYYDKLSPDMKARLKRAFDRRKTAEPNMHEWMANQFVAWAYATNKQAQDGVESFFKTVAKKIEAVWKQLIKAFGLSQTFREYMDGVALYARGERAERYSDRALHHNPIVRDLTLAGADGGAFFKGLNKELTKGKKEGALPYTGPEAISAAGTKVLKEQFAKLGLTENGTSRALGGLMKGVKDGLVGLHDVVLASLDGRLRRSRNTDGQPIKAHNVLASMFWRAPGDHVALQGMLDDANVEPDVKGVINEILRSDTFERMSRNNLSGLHTLYKQVFDGMSKEDARELLQELYQAEATGRDAFSPKHAAKAELFRAMMKAAFEMSKDAGLPIRQRKRYTPFAFDRELMIEKKEELIELLLEHGLNGEVRANGRGFSAKERASAERIFQNLLDTTAPLPLEKTNEPKGGTGVSEDGRDNMRAAGHGFTLERGLWQDMTPELREKLNAFRQDDPHLLIQEYLAQVAKSSAFNQKFGQHAIEVRARNEDGSPKSDKQGRPVLEWNWDPLHKFGILWREATREGATKAQVIEVHKLMEAYLGRTGMSFSPATRKMFGYVQFYQNVRLLLFSVLASLQDILGPMIRTGAPLKVLQSYKKYIQLGKEDRAKLKGMARAYAVVSEELNDHILSTEYDNHYTTGRTANLNDKFFRAIGMKKWTDMTRALALHASIDYVLQHGHGAKNGLARSQEIMNELGLDPDTVMQWAAEGQPTTGTNGKKMGVALRRLNDEMILRPTAALRPAWASHPAMALVWHLKSFTWTFQKTYGSRFWYELNRQGASGPEAASVMTSALLLLPLAAFGLELRELLQYDLFGTKSPFDGMTGGEYFFEISKRSGVLGLSQMLADYSEADERGKSATIAIAGPTLGQLEELLTKPASQSLPRSVPIMSQIPGLREEVRNFLISDD